MANAQNNLLHCLLSLVTPRLAKHTGQSKAKITAAIKAGLASGTIPTTSWLVENPDGTRSPQRFIERFDFFARLGAIGLSPIPADDQGQVWPRDQFEDKVQRQIDHLTDRWVTHAGRGCVVSFSTALNAAGDDLAVFSFKTGSRSISRDLFADWFTESEFALVLSVAADVKRPVSVDDLCPAVELWTNMSRQEAVIRAFELEYPDGHLAGDSKKKRNHKIGKRLKQHGFLWVPNAKSIWRYLKDHGG